jgi:hypothetical protein
VTVSREKLFAYRALDSYARLMTAVSGRRNRKDEDEAAARGDQHRVHYVRRPFHREPNFGLTSVNYKFSELLARAEPLR